MKVALVLLVVLTASAWAEVAANLKFVELDGLKREPVREFTLRGVDGIALWDVSNRRIDVYFSPQRLSPDNLRKALKFKGRDDFMAAWGEVWRLELPLRMMGGTQVSANNIANPRITFASKQIDANVICRVTRPNMALTPIELVAKKGFKPGQPTGAKLTFSLTGEDAVMGSATWDFAFDLNLKEVPIYYR